MAILNPDYSSLNHEEMAAAIGLKAKHIPMLLGSFLEESIVILQNLEIAIKDNNYESIKLYAHSIKGSAGNLKFNEIYEISKEVELAASNSDVNFDYNLYFKAIKGAIETISI